MQEKTSLLAETSIKLGLRPDESKTKVMKINAKRKQPIKIKHTNLEEGEEFTYFTFELKIFIFVPLEMFLVLYTFPRMLKMTLALLILFFTSASVPPSIFTMLPR
jgi:hypothetical protein